MKTMKPIRLSRKTAVGLIRSVVPVSPQAIEGGEQAPGVFTYTAQTEGLEIICNNGCYHYDRVIHLIISDRLGGGVIHMCFGPESLARDLVAEAAYKADERRKDREEWARKVGRATAHNLVDQYCK